MPWQAEVAYPQLLHPVAELFHHAGEPLAEGHPRSGVRHVPAVQVRVGPKDVRSRDPHDGVLRCRTSDMGLWSTRTRSVPRPLMAGTDTVTFFVGFYTLFLAAPTGIARSAFG